MGILILNAAEQSPQTHLPACQPALTEAERHDSLVSVSPASDWTVSWWSVDGGGDTSTGAAFELIGTIGQPDAGRLTGSNHVLNGGFCAGIGRTEIFTDGFESGDFSRWSLAVGGI
jgi:hypothetical protein